LEGPSETVSLEKLISYGKYDPVVPGKERSPQDYDYTMWQTLMAKVYEMDEVKAVLAKAVEVKEQEGLKLFN